MLARSVQHLGTFSTPQMAEEDAQNVRFLLTLDPVRETLGYRSRDRTLVRIADAEALKAADEFSVAPLRR
jgi:hypothetical protein